MNDDVSESSPSVEELYDYLNNNNYNNKDAPLRYIDFVKSVFMLINIFLLIKVDNIKLYIENNKLKMLCIVETENPHNLKIHLKDIQESLGDTFYEGCSGSELCYPSKKDYETILGFIGFDVEIE
jgi:hypothetical protein